MLCLPRKKTAVLGFLFRSTDSNDPLDIANWFRQSTYDSDDLIRLIRFMGGQTDNKLVAVNTTVETINSLQYGRCYKIEVHQTVRSVSDFLLIGLKFPDKVKLFRFFLSRIYCIFHQFQTYQEIRTSC